MTLPKSLQELKNAVSELERQLLELQAQPHPADLLAQVQHRATLESAAQIVSEKRQQLDAALAEHEAAQRQQAEAKARQAATAKMRSISEKINALGPEVEGLIDELLEVAESAEIPVAGSLRVPRIPQVREAGGVWQFINLEPEKVAPSRIASGEGYLISL